MFSRRLLLHAQRHRRFVGTLLGRNPMLRFSAIGRRLARGGVNSVSGAPRFVAPLGFTPEASLMTAGLPVEPLAETSPAFSLGASDPVSLERYASAEPQSGAAPVLAGPPMAHAAREPETATPDLPPVPQHRHTASLAAPFHTPNTPEQPVAAPQMRPVTPLPAPVRAERTPQGLPASAPPGASPDAPGPATPASAPAQIAAADNSTPAVPDTPLNSDAAAASAAADQTVAPALPTSVDLPAAQAVLGAEADTPDSQRPTSLLTTPTNSAHPVLPKEQAAAVRTAQPAPVAPPRERSAATQADHAQAAAATDSAPTVPATPEVSATEPRTGTVLTAIDAAVGQDDAPPPALSATGLMAIDPAPQDATEAAGPSVRQLPANSEGIASETPDLPTTGSTEALRMSSPTPPSGVASEAPEGLSQAPQIVTPAVEPPAGNVLGRRARFEEIGVRNAAPMLRRPERERSQAENVTAHDIFGDSGQPRDRLEWGRLLFAATDVSQQRQPVPGTLEVPAQRYERGQGQPASPQPSQNAYGPGSPLSQLPPQIPARPPVPSSGQATRVTETTRRFLRPLVGIDPVEVPVHRGASAAALTELLHADGVALNDEIYLAAGRDEEREPATQALLAHEMLHVARRRQARFVPPIGRDQAAVSADEEALARTVEARTRVVAEQQRTLSSPVEAAAPLVGSVVPSAGLSSTAATPAPPTVPSGIDHWNGLPAPWEPLPSAIGAVRTNTAAPAEPAAAAPLAAPAAPTIALAAVDRAAEAPPAPAQQQGVGQQTEPADIDALARQVYAVLKQRLAAERRRLG